MHNRRAAVSPQYQLLNTTRSHTLACILKLLKHLEFVIADMTGCYRPSDDERTTPISLDLNLPISTQVKPVTESLQIECASFIHR